MAFSPKSKRSSPITGDNLRRAARAALEKEEDNARRLGLDENLPPSLVPVNSAALAASNDPVALRMKSSHLATFFSRYKDGISSPSGPLQARHLRHPLYEGRRLNPHWANADCPASSPPKIFATTPSACTAPKDERPMNLPVRHVQADREADTEKDNNKAVVNGGSSTMESLSKQRDTLVLAFEYRALIGNEDGPDEELNLNPSRSRKEKEEERPGHVQSRSGAEDPRRVRGSFAELAALAPDGTAQPAGEAPHRLHSSQHLRLLYIHKRDPAVPPS